MDIKELKVSIGDSRKKNHPWEYARSKVVLHILKKYLKKHSKGASIDVGCGDVFFLTRFADEYPNYKLIAVDTAFDGEIISKIVSKTDGYDIRFFNNVNNVSFEGEATVVFLLDVIEHIDEDVQFLKELSTQSFIGTETIIAITVPAFNTLYCNHDKWLGHYRRYSYSFLKQQIERAGLNCQEGGYFFTSLLLPRYIQKIIEKIRNSKEIRNQGIGDYKGGAVISFLYEKFLLVDFYFFRIIKCLGIRVPGLSTYVICKQTKI